MRSRLFHLRTFVAALLLVFAPQLASAHNTFGDLGSFNNGFVHPLTVAQHMLVLLSLGVVFIFSGKEGPRGILALLVGFIAGFALVNSGYSVEWMPVFIIAFAITLGIIGLLGRSLDGRIVVSLAVIAGFFIGMDTDTDLSKITDYAKFMSGALLAITFLESCLLCLGFAMTKDWQKAGLRILSSWIATISLLYLAFLIRK